MTGVELALAVLPLAISAAEHHRHLWRSLRTVSSSRIKAREQLEFFYELGDELGMLSATLQKLIRNLPSYDASLEALLTDGNDRTLVRDTLKDDVERILGNNAETFNSILDRTLKYINALVKDQSLALEDVDIVSMEEPASMHRKLNAFKVMIEQGTTRHDLRDRFRFTKNETTRANALKKIINNNKKLERLLNGSVTAVRSDPPEHRPRLRELPTTRKRRLSEPLFNKMANKWPKTCDCGAEHEARLCLWNCCSIDDGNKIDMLMSLGDAGSPSYSWSESTITVSPEIEEACASQSTVRFAVDDSESPRGSSPRSPGEDIETKSLCSLLKQAHHRRRSLSMIFEHGKLWRIQSRAASLTAAKPRDSSLGHLLREEGHSLRLKQKSILAVILAHAALHCSDGPWLSEQWDKEHVTFFWNPAVERLDLAKPYLTVRFNASTSESTSANISSSQSGSALLALGILLLEIHLDKPIEKSWLPEHLSDGVPNENTNLTTACLLLEELEDELYEGYRGAVAACLQSNYAGLNSEEARRLFYEQIVFPLERELEHGFGIKPENLHLYS